ncbi:hypothetical protein DY000_02051080 [Brassica cretica]|uniref:MIF4G domain-containing protein n=1 Tax=Brassica cretica TaxID=69181 RepID=A0ABQ7ES95_BRACR|nr:hypothetical protein DY000_02051080 [Brassica cretica]
MEGEGVYVPAFRRKEKTIDVERESWDELKRRINALVNKVSVHNLRHVVSELFEEDLIRGRGLLCRSCLKSQIASPSFTDVIAALIAVVNSKLPSIGDLLLKRLVLQIRRAFDRNDKPLLLAVVKFLAHLVNQRVACEIIALEVIHMLLRKPTEDTVEVAVVFVRECGALLLDLSPRHEEAAKEAVVVVDQKVNEISESPDIEEKESNDGSNAYNLSPPYRIRSKRTAVFKSRQLEFISPEEEKADDDTKSSEKDKVLDGGDSQLPV